MTKIYRTNEIKILGKTVIIKIIDKINTYIIELDLEDYEDPNKTIKGYKWNIESGYAYSRGKTLHRYILPKIKGLVIDHIDRNKLNNKKSNLRHVTQTENKRNQKVNVNNQLGIRGISIRGKKYCACISVDGIYKSLGYFDTLNSAIEARLEGEKKLWGKIYSQIEKA